MPVAVEITDESAKIDINTASDPLLRGLLVPGCAEGRGADRLLDAILDWRDPDALKRPNGAEEADYRAASLTYRPANSTFQADRGAATRARHASRYLPRLAPSLTVFSRQTGVNPQFASRDVLLAIPHHATARWSTSTSPQREMPPRRDKHADPDLSAGAACSPWPTA
jgi:general secretion pathway protein K